VKSVVLAIELRQSWIHNRSLHRFFSFLIEERCKEER
jgi:hypothetical protein